MYVATGLLVLGAVAYRYWVTKKGRPTFASSLERSERPPDRTGAGASRTLAPAISTAATEDPSR
jgi:hypothetical protein